MQRVSLPLDEHHHILFSPVVNEIGLRQNTKGPKTLCHIAGFALFILQYILLEVFYLYLICILYRRRDKRNNVICNIVLLNIFFNFIALLASIFSFVAYIKDIISFDIFIEINCICIFLNIFYKKYNR